MSGGIRAAAGQPASRPGSSSTLKSVALASGSQMQVQNDDEKAWFEGTRDHYVADYALTEATDIRDIDRLLVMELMTHRWTQHLAAGRDYGGGKIDDKALRANLRDYAGEISKLKASLGISKEARDKAANTGSVAQYLSDLRMRAKAFGIHRDNQTTKAIALLKEIFALVVAYDNSDTEERVKLGLETPDAILEWVRDTAMPEFNQLDEDFRNNHQRLWVKQQ